MTDVPAAAPLPPPAGASGWFAVEGDNVVRGWCRDRKRPDLRLDVAIRINGAVVATVRADRLNERLVESGEGDGRFAFAWAVPPVFIDGHEHTIAVEVATEGYRQSPLKTRRAAFSIPAGTAVPAATLRRVGPDAIEGVLTGPPGLREELDVWLDGRRLEPDEWSAEWGWSDRQALPFRLSLAATDPLALLGRNLAVAYTGTVPDPAAPSLAQLADKRVEAAGDGWYRLTFGAGLAFPPRATILAELLPAASGAAASLARLRLTLVDNVADFSLDETLTGTRIRLRLLTEDGRRIGEDLLLAPTPVPRRMLTGGLAGFAPGSDVTVERGHYAFPPTLKDEWGLTGELLAAQLGPGARERVMLSHAMRPFGGEAAAIGLALFVRASRPVPLALRLMDGDAERASLPLTTGTRWRGARLVADLAAAPLAAPRLELVADPGHADERLVVEVAGVHCGAPDLHTLADAPRPIPPNIGADVNRVVNADLVSWPAGLAFQERTTRFELADGWSLANPEGGAAEVAAGPAPNGAPGHYALSLSVSAPVRVEVRLAGVAAGMGELTFAARLGDKAATMWNQIDRVRLVRRRVGGPEPDLVAAVIARRVVLTRRWEQLRFAFTTTPREQDGFDLPGAADEWLLVFELDRPTALMLADVQLRFGVPPQPATPGPLAWEDRNVAAQVGALRGLEGWRGERALHPAVRAPLPPPPAEPRRWRWPALAAGTVEVAVPVHNAADETLGCLRALADAGGVPHTVRILDDGSDEDTRQRVLAFIAERPWMRFDPNPQHLGYTATAQRAMTASDADWVVLLNSDTVVTPGWLDGLLSVAADDARTGAVGPVSNAASYQSVPETHDGTGRWAVNALPPGWSPANMGALVAEAAPRDAPDVPLLNGFCLCLRREAVLAVGGFDVAAFPQGYGEENDLCLRLRKAGWRLRLAAHVYVHHLKSRSFGHARRTDLSRAGDLALRALHPDVDFAALGRTFLSVPALAEVRAAVRAAWPTCVAGGA